MAALLRCFVVAVFCKERRSLVGYLCKFKGGKRWRMVFDNPMAAFKFQTVGQAKVGLRSGVIRVYTDSDNPGYRGGRFHYYAEVIEAVIGDGKVIHLETHHRRGLSPLEELALEAE